MTARMRRRCWQVTASRAGFRRPRRTASESGAGGSGVRRGEATVGRWRFVNSFSCESRYFAAGVAPDRTGDLHSHTAREKCRGCVRHGSSRRWRSKRGRDRTGPALHQTLEKMLLTVPGCGNGVTVGAVHSVRTAASASFQNAEASQRWSRYPRSERGRCLHVSLRALAAEVPTSAFRAPRIPCPR